MKHYLLLTFAAVVFLSSCVTRQKYQEMEETSEYYKTEAQSADSIRNEYNKLAEERRQLEIEIRNTRLELEEFAEVLVLKVVILEVSPPLGEYLFELAMAVELIVDN